MVTQQTKFPESDFETTEQSRQGILLCLAQLAQECTARELKFSALMIKAAIVALEDEQPSYN